jgi:membrane-bound lytic murein transglycosylase B
MGSTGRSTANNGTRAAGSPSRYPRPDVGKATAAGAALLVLVTALVVVGPTGHAVDTAARTAPVTGVPAGLVAVAREAGALTGVDPNVLLAISRVECDCGRCRSGQPDGLVPADVRTRVDAGALQPGGATARLLGIADGRRLGDWVNPAPVAGGEHAMGFMQFLPSTWRQESSRAPGSPRDPYRPRDSMVVAGSYLARLQRGAVDGHRHGLRSAIAVYGGSDDYADQVLALAAAG